MKETIKVINQMRADGVICHYGLGGGVAAAYYIDPAATLDMEVLVILPFDAHGESATLSSLHRYFIARDFSWDGQHFEIAGWPVRISVARSELERQAVASSLPESVDGETTWLLMAEYLIAILLTGNSSKDQMWIQRLNEADAYDEGTLKSILKSNGMIAKWEEFEQKFPSQFPKEEGMDRRLARFSDKVKILERLRDRSRVLANGGLRKKATSTEKDEMR